MSIMRSADAPASPSSAATRLTEDPGFSGRAAATSSRHQLRTWPGAGRPSRVRGEIVVARMPLFQFPVRRVLAKLPA